MPPTDMESNPHVKAVKDECDKESFPIPSLATSCAATTSKGEKVIDS